VSEESYVRSFVLAGKNRIGYLSLPDFYTRWGNEGEGSRCANDVAKEILKLKKEKIDGLILDVRYNGGGSLQEAVALAGIFIDEGTLGFLKDRQKTIPLKDINRGTIYDGPLLVMVNGQSASASEFLAAALQDYHRAMIVGSRTFGKASAQNIFPLDRTQNLSSLENIKNYIGYATITTDKLYRATGKSAQGYGVEPDIALPDIFELLDYHEAELPFALPADTLARKSYLKTLPPIPLRELQERTRARLDQREPFRELKSILASFAERDFDDEEPVALKWQAITDAQQQKKIQEEKLKKTFFAEGNSYQVSNTTLDMQRMSIDGYAKEINTLWTHKLMNDLYLDESFQIICDYIERSKKP
jgi:carboxyl-terminal processing protease